MALTQTQIVQPSTGNKRFTIVRPHARGGLGEVFLARDTELNREVAVKQIVSERSSNTEAQNRFRLEAEITGGLEHPGIVPVYSLGTNQDGQPFYAMRFIRGENLKEAIKRFHETGASHSDKNLAFRELLGRFIDVCNSIEYAHSRGVLHRDLKPNNVMLGRFGETLVVDWGLARATGQSESPPLGESMGPIEPASGSDITPTRDGSVIGTLQYMSPEQALGKIDELGPATDVYSMGAILFEILTNRPPIERVLSDDGKLDIGGTIRLIDEASIAFPPARPEFAAKPLWAICLKALERQPGERYSSVAELARDVQRWLGDEPVGVFRENFLERSSRWLRRYRTFATAAASVLLMGLILLGTFSAILSGKNRELTNANTLALESEETAREQSQLALETLATVIGEMQSELQDVPGTSPVRKRLVATALSKLQRISRDHLDNARVDGQTIVGLIKMGDLIMDFGGNLSGEEKDPTNDGDSRARLAHLYYDKSLQIAQSLFRSQPTNNTFRTNVATCFERRGDANGRLGNVTDALTDYRESVRLHKSAPDSSRAESKLSISLVQERIGDILLNSGRTAEALRLFNSRLDTLKSSLSKDPDNTELQQQISGCYDRIANAHLQVARTADAREAYAQSLRIVERLAVTYPNNQSIQHDYGVTLQGLIDVQLLLGETVAAQQTAMKTVATFEELVSKDPEKLRSRRNLSLAYSRLGATLERTGATRQVLEAYQKALGHMQALATLAPEDIGFAVDLLRCHSHIGSVQQELGDNDTARGSFEMAKQIASDWLRLRPDSFAVQEQLASVNDRLGNLYETTSDLRSATDAYKNSSRLFASLAIRDPGDMDLQRALAVVTGKLGVNETKLGNSEEALAACNQSLQAFRNLAASDETNVERQREVAIALSRVREVYVLSGKFTEALPPNQEQLAILDRLVRANPSDTRATIDYSIANLDLGDVLFRLGKPAHALESFNTGRHHIQPIAESDPSNLQVQQLLAGAHSKIAEVELELGHAEQARDAIGTALRIEKKLAGIATDNRSVQRGLALSYYKLGDIEQRTGDAGAALDAYRGGLEVFRTLSSSDRDNGQATRDLGLALTKVANLELQAQNKAAALKLFREKVRVTESLASMDRKNANWQYDLVFAHYRLGVFFRDENQLSEAIESFSASIAVSQSMVDAGLNIEESERTLASTKSWLLETQALKFAKENDFADATKTARELCAMANVDSNQLYNSACLFALAAGSLKAGEKTVPESKIEQWEAWSAGSIAMLKRSIEAGWKDFEHIRNDTDLDAVRDLEAFKELIPKEQPEAAASDGDDQSTKDKSPE